MQYRLFMPKQAAGANLVYFDLFNASWSGQVVEVVSIIPVVSGAVAVVGTLAVDLFLTRTTSVGTGGTAASWTNTSLTSPGFVCCAPRGSALSSGITARLTPTGGAAAGPVIGWRSVSTEETNAGSYTPPIDLARAYYDDLQGIVVDENTGLRVVQGAVASVGNIGFDVTLRVFKS